MIIRGKVKWAKIVGEPGWGYQNQHKEWSVDVSIDEDTRAKLLAEGMGEQHIKNKRDDRGDFITLKRREKRADGTPATPIEIKDKYNRPWGGDKIGNGSVLNLKLALNESRVPGQKGLKPSLIKCQVWEHVPFEDGEDFEAAEPGTDEPWA